MTEIWLPVPSISYVEASSLGRIRSLPKAIKTPKGNGIRIFERPPTFGYLTNRGRHQVSAGGTTHRVARLVCEAFHGPSPSPKHECMHLDENAINNRPENLSWGTKEENQSAPKLVKAKRQKILERGFPNWKLSKADIEAIQSARGTLKAVAISAQWNIHRVTVYKIWAKAAV